MSTTIIEPESAPQTPAGVLDDIETYSPQFLYEHGVVQPRIEDTDSGGLRISLDPSAAGNAATCTADFHIEAAEDTLTVSCLETYGDHTHISPGLELSFGDGPHGGLLSWLRLWAAAWIDKAHRS